MIRIILIFLVISGLVATFFWKPLQKPDNLEERVKALENSMVSIRANLANPKPSVGYESRITALEKDVAQFKNQTTQTPQTPSKSPSYIPLGSGGTAGDKGWYSVPGYEVLIDPADYPGYSGMQLEVNFRLAEKSGIGYARLYNQTDNLSVGGELSSGSDSFTLQSTSSFKLPSGKKIYRLQVKNTEGVNLEVQNARIKVNY